MNFQQLKIIREAARQDYNLTEVANMLFTSQSGVSRHIRELEDELGIEIFVRRGKRLLGMTEPGKALLVIAERILNEASNVRRLADLFTNDTSGVLNRPGFPGECFICELRLPDHRFRWKHNKLFLLLPEEYGPAFPAIVDCYTSPPTLVWPVPLLHGFSSS
ncbi:bacterial regulatory helix-turn-helix, lysR family protein, partial [Escherichia coli 99.1793]